ncbi:hypothetical protein FF1_044425 [Malus domestica]
MPASSRSEEVSFLQLFERTQWGLCSSCSRFLIKTPVDLTCLIYWRLMIERLVMERPVMEWWVLKRRWVMVRVFQSQMGASGLYFLM